MIPFVDSILNIVGKFIPDQAQRDQIKADITAETTKQMKMQSDLIQIEMNSGSWLTRNWRPLFMVLCCTMMGVHWLMYDVLVYLRTALDLNVWLPQDPGLSEELWITIRIGLGGYIGGRTAEKIAKIIKS